jgi:hypothetical protein
MATDPYAAIRNLQLNETPTYGWDVYNPQTASDGRGGYYADETDPSTLGYAPQDFGIGDSSDVRWVKQGAQTGSDYRFAFSPEQQAYQSKFNEIQMLPDGRMVATLQQPGAHKYDLMQAVYAKDPSTGQWTLQGDPSNFKQQSRNTSMLQGVGTGLATVGGMAVAGPMAGALGGGILGAAGAGAILGAANPLLSGGNSDAILKGAVRGGVTGGAMGGISDYMGNIDPLSPMEVPSAEWQNVPTGNIDAALNHVSPALDGAIGSGVQHLTPAAMESMIGTPGYGINASADAYLEGIGSPNLSGVNATVPPEYLNSGNWNAQGTLPDTPVNPTQTIDVTGNKIDYGDGSAFPTTSTPTTPTGLPQADYSHEGNNYPTSESTQGPGGSPVNASPAAPGLGSKIGDFFKANPKLAISLLGSVFGGGKGGSGAGNGGTGGAQAGMTATQAPKFQRQYVAPPAGYRPGFDPEHKYFTGIGNVGTGG